MAEKAFTYLNTASGAIINDAVLPSWTLALGDVGTPVIMGAHSDRTVHFFGTFGGGAVSLRGSNKPAPDPSVAADWFPLTDPKLNTPLENITSASGYVIYENPLFISPVVSGGDGTTSITISILGRKRQ